MFAAIVLPGVAKAEVDWQTRNTIKTKKTPIDIQITADGKKTFILTEGGRLEIYDSNAAMIDSIKVDPDMNILSADGTGMRVFLGNSKNNSVHELLIETIAEFNYEGSPYLGKKEAPVVLAVFSDFQ
jgi:hypothetical protein